MRACPDRAETTACSAGAVVLHLGRLWHREELVSRRAQPVSRGAQHRNTVSQKRQRRVRILQPKRYQDPTRIGVLCAASHSCGALSRRNEEPTRLTRGGEVKRKEEGSSARFGVSPILSIVGCRDRPHRLLAERLRHGVADHTREAELAEGPIPLRSLPQDTERVRVNVRLLVPSMWSGAK